MVLSSFKILWIRLLRENGFLKPLIFVRVGQPFWWAAHAPGGLLWGEWTEERAVVEILPATVETGWLGLELQKNEKWSGSAREMGLLGVVRGKAAVLTYPLSLPCWPVLIRDQSFWHPVCTVKFVACFLDWLNSFGEVFIYKWGLMLIYLSEGGDKSSIAFWSSFSNEMYLFWEVRYLICLKSRQKI